MSTAVTVAASWGDRVRGECGLGTQGPASKEEMGPGPPSSRSTSGSARDVSSTPESPTYARPRPPWPRDSLPRSLAAVARARDDRRRRIRRDDDDSKAQGRDGDARGDDRGAVDGGALGGRQLARESREELAGHRVAAEDELASTAERRRAQPARKRGGAQPAPVCRVHVEALAATRRCKFRLLF